MLTTRSLFAIGMTASLLLHCTHAEEVMIPTAPAVLNIVVFDQSSSANYIDCDTAELRRLTLVDAFESQVWNAGIRVLAKDSNQQEVLLDGPFHLPLMSEEGRSIYQLNEIRTFNQEAQSGFEEKIKDYLSLFDDSILGTHNLAYSDVKGALQLVGILSRQQRFQAARIRLILLSDLLQDIPGDHTLGSFIFPPHTKIYAVGVAPTVDLEKVFPENDLDQLVRFSAEFFSNP